MDNKIRVGLIGMGRSGRAVARVLAESEDVALRWIAKRSAPSEVERLTALAPVRSLAAQTWPELLNAEPVDALMDFSGPAALHNYGMVAAEKRVCIISAVSNYSATERRLAERLARRTALMVSPNITLGINFLLVASRLLQHVAPFADIEVIEEHFRDKHDRSGTALRIAETLGLDDDRINSVRVGGIVGRHEVVFGFPYQTVRLVHESIGREAFGNGALFALRNIYGRPPGFYRFEEILIESMREVLNNGTFAASLREPERMRA